MHYTYCCCNFIFCLAKLCTVPGKLFSVWPIIPQLVITNYRLFIYTILLMPINIHWLLTCFGRSCFLAVYRVSLAFNTHLDNVIFTLELNRIKHSSLHSTNGILRFCRISSRNTERKISHKYLLACNVTGLMLDRVCQPRKGSA